MMTLTGAPKSSIKRNFKTHCQVPLVKIFVAKLKVILGEAIQVYGYKNKTRGAWMVQ